GTTDAPSPLVTVGDRVLPFEQKRRACGLDPPTPQIRADEVGKLPIRAALHHPYLLSGPCPHRPLNLTPFPGTHDDDVHFVVCHVTTSSSARCGACRECRARHSRPWCRRPRPRHRCARAGRRTTRPGPANPRSCSGAYYR